ncbi:MAG: FtsH protease activity modulator HflK [bacterium]|nr:FtsH protease activity modulator HflK [bacterium]
MASEEPRTIDIGQFRPPPGGGPKIIGIALAVIVGLFLVLTTFFTIEPEEVGVVLRFGKYIRTAEPGLNFKMPSPIEQVLKVPVQRQLKEEFGFRTREPGVRTVYSPSDFQNESLMLTGDLNVAVVEWIAQYRVSDPMKFLFRVRNVQQTFRDMTEAVMRAVIGDRSVDEVLTIGRQQIENEVKIKLQELCEKYETGITVDQVVLQDVTPPDPVKPSFNEVNQAEQEKERAINEARSEYNRIIPRARGEAQQMIAQANGYAIDRTNSAKGEVVLFDEVLAAYRRAPEVTRRRMYLETMAVVFANVDQKILLDKELQGILPLLPINKGGDQ